MKHWKETADVLARALRLAEAGRRAAIATVVGIQGSAYRRPGAKFLVDADGGTAGSISGGCLEADVREVALQVIGGAPPRLLRYDTGGDDSSPFTLGLGCSGSVEIFVQPAASEGALETAKAILELLREDREAPFALATPLAGAAAGRTLVVTAEGVRAGSTADDALDRRVAARAAEHLARRETRRDSPEDGGAAIFTEVLLPPPHLLIFGAGDDSIPLCTYSSDAGFRVTVVDHREAALSPERFPGAFRRVVLRPQSGTASLPAGPRALAVVKTHSFAHDREWVRGLLAAGVPYVGLLGPRARAGEVLAQLGVNDEDAAARVFAPVGLDLGAEGPEQVAVAIVAELLSVHSSREPASLRSKRTTIHAG